MPRAFWPTALRVGAALGLVISLAAPAWGQTTIFNSNGFETPTFSSGTIFGQQSGLWQTAPGNPAGLIQTATVLNGSQAFHIDGPTMNVPGYSNTGANFWYRNDFTYTPTVSTPFVQVQFSAQRTATGFFDMPLAGVYLETISSFFGQPQQLVTITMSSDGRLAASTTSTQGGSAQTVTTQANQFGADVWHGLFAELNFNTQSYKVYREGDANPIQFQNVNGQPITEIPFRNTLGTSLTVKEIGMLAFNFNSSTDPGNPAWSAPTNHFYIDDYMVTASATSLAPVPEPSLVLAVGAVGLTGWRVYRRRRAAVSTQV